MTDLFPPLTIFLIIAMQLFIAGMVDRFKPARRSKLKHRAVTWGVMFVSIIFTVGFARALCDLTWNDFTIVDDSYRHHGIMLRTVLIPVPIICILLVYWSVWCDPKTKEPHINLSILYLLGVTLMFIHMAFPSVL